jgi:photosystem II stability/assembly factor-like uncharacterized protein
MAQPADAVRALKTVLAFLCVTLAVLPAQPAGAAKARKPAKAPAAGAATLPDGLFDRLDFRQIGPVGNRVPAVVGVPGDANTYYVGAASGGIWKSGDGGHSWKPIFDAMKVASIGALAVAPSDPNVIWAGTGEAFLRSNVSIGDGVYRSTDAGANWTRVGLEKTGRIGRIVVHPDDPDVAWVAALGHAYGPQQDRGVFRTLDGGKTWRKVLFVDELTGASDVVLDPNNPRILFAGMWHIELKTCCRQSGGPGSGLWTSRDGGETWKQLEGGGLPPKPWGKVALTLSKADSQRVYALIETSSNRDFSKFDDFAGVLWRSDDGGGSWAMVNADNTLAQRPLYYSRMLAAPDDADEVHFMAVLQTRSLDGGRTVKVNNSGWDHHDIWIDPLLPNRIITGHDGGVSISTDRGRSWHKPQLPIAQMYHVAVDDEIPYNVYGNRQDGHALRGPSSTLTYSGIPIGAWQSVGGCEVGFTLPDPSDANLIWAGCYDGILNLYDHRTRVARDVSVWPEAIEAWPAAELKYRFQWTFPLMISPHDPKRVYAGSQFLHETRDGGQTWRAISSDLTTNDPKLQQRTGGLTLDDAGPTLAPTLFALAESPLRAGELWTGSNDGLVHVSRDGGKTWTNVTANLPGLPEHGTISNIEPSRHRAGTVYLTVDRHQLGDFAAYVFVTRDHGATWRRIVDGIPTDVFGYAHVVREDPQRQGLLYLGVENGLYVSFDDGGRWHRMQGNLPPAPVHWLVVQERFNDLVVGTYGRGFHILDDLGAVQQFAVGGDRPALYKPRDTWRFQQREVAMTQPEDPVAGRDPEYGAAIDYFLPEEHGGKIELEIFDAEGRKVRALEKAGTAKGLNRIYWDLRREPSAEIKLRTKPLENSKQVLPDSGWRELPDGARLAPLALPGTYQVRLTLTPKKPEKTEGTAESKADSAAAARGVKGEEKPQPVEAKVDPAAVETGEPSKDAPATATAAAAASKTVLEQPLTLLKDPQLATSDADLAAQERLVRELYELQQRSARLINQAEWLRKELVDLRARLEDRPPGEEKNPHQATLDEIAKVDKRLQAVEGFFFDLRLTNASQDTLRWKRLIYAKLSQLGWAAERGEGPPTASQLEVAALLAQNVADAERQLQEVVDQDLATLRASLLERRLGLLSVALEQSVQPAGGTPGAEAGGGV